MIIHPIACETCVYIDKSFPFYLVREQSNVKKVYARFECLVGHCRFLEHHFNHVCVFLNLYHIDDFYPKIAFFDFGFEVYKSFTAHKFGQLSYEYGLMCPVVWWHYGDKSMSSE